jgi:hypothetical protein
MRRLIVVSAVVVALLGSGVPDAGASRAQGAWSFVRYGRFVRYAAVLQIPAPVFADAPKIRLPKGAIVDEFFQTLRDIGYRRPRYSLDEVSSSIQTNDPITRNVEFDERVIKGKICKALTKIIQHGPRTLNAVALAHELDSRLDESDDTNAIEFLDTAISIHKKVKAVIESKRWEWAAGVRHTWCVVGL